MKKLIEYENDFHDQVQIWIPERDESIQHHEEAVIRAGNGDVIYRGPAIHLLTGDRS